MVREIDKDLVRWSPRNWASTVCLILVLQVGLIVWSSRDAPERVIYPAEPAFAFVSPAAPVEPVQEWLELENPFLFAAADWNGFSGEAWLRKPDWRSPQTARTLPVRFLGVTEAGSLRAKAPAPEPFVASTPRRPAAVLPGLAIPDRAIEQVSRLVVEGFAGRPLSASPPLPVQYHNDAVGATVVEASIDRDGLVVLARLADRSGSPRADADAINLARQARFAPAPLGENSLASGKLIFQWFALDLSHTNNVTR